MPSEKRYFWLKLHKDFFNSKRIKKLRKLAGGDTYTIIYLKMQLLSLTKGGVLEYTGLENTFAEEIALDIDEDVDNVAVTLQFLMSCGLIETSDEIEYFLPYVVDNIGSETSDAQRMRDKRKKDKKEQLPNNVRTNFENCYGEIDIEIEEDIEKEKELEKDIHTSADFKEIVDYLNLVTGSSYRYQTRKTQSLIKARMNEGFSVDDFKTVIDKKNAEWGNDTKMSKFLRPETLFGNKFESYLNQQTRDSRDAYIDKWANA